jgi:hypothetical protein
MDANTLMTMLLQEAERQDLRAQKLKQSTGKGKEDEKNEALAVSTEKPKGKRDMLKITCWNCGNTGHFSSKCDKPKKTKDQPSTSDPKKEGTSAAAVDNSSDDKGAWVAEEVGDESADWFLEVVNGVSSVDSDWFQEVVDSEEELSSVEDDIGCVDEVDVAVDGVPVLLKDSSSSLTFGSLYVFGDAKLTA